VGQIEATEGCSVDLGKEGQVVLPVYFEPGPVKGEPPFQHVGLWEYS